MHARRFAKHVLPHAAAGGQQLAILSTAAECPAGRKLVVNHCELGCWNQPGDDHDAIPLQPHDHLGHDGGRRADGEVGQCDAQRRGRPELADKCNLRDTHEITCLSECCKLS